MKDAATLVSAPTFSPCQGHPPGGAATGTHAWFCSLLLEERFPQVNLFCLRQIVLGQPLFSIKGDLEGRPLELWDSCDVSTLSGK